MATRKPAWSSATTFDAIEAARRRSSQDERLSRPAILMARIWRGRPSRCRWRPSRVSCTCSSAHGSPINIQNILRVHGTGIVVDQPLDGKGLLGPGTQLFLFRAVPGKAHLKPEACAIGVGALADFRLIRSFAKSQQGHDLLRLLRPFRRVESKDVGKDDRVGEAI